MTSTHQIADPQQVSRILDEIPERETPTVVFLVGSAGSGKSTLVSSFADSIQNPKAISAEFDKSTKWEDHIDEFDSQEDCQREILKGWIASKISENPEVQLFVLEANAQIDHVLQSFHDIGLSSAECILVQPPNDVRSARVVNDSRRSVQTPEAFRRQLDENVAESIFARAKELGIVHIPNIELSDSLNQLSGVCARLLKP